MLAPTRACDASRTSAGWRARELRELEAEDDVDDAEQGACAWASVTSAAAFHWRRQSTRRL